MPNWSIVICYFPNVTYLHLILVFSIDGLAWILADCHVLESTFADMTF